MADAQTAAVPTELTDAELDYVSGGGFMLGNPIGNGILTAAEMGGHAPSPTDMPTPSSGVTPGLGRQTSLSAPGSPHTA